MPTRQICAHLNAFHAYASDPKRAVEANHYCAHLNEDVRQCILYDGAGSNARIIGIEYMVSEKVFKTLDAEEKKLWHSHVFEVKSGMLIMPPPPTSSLTGALAGATGAWDQAELKEMEEAITLYGKIYHLWQVDRGDVLPLGEPQLMTSFTAADQFDFETLVTERDKRFGTDWRKKKEQRKYIPEPQIDPDADWTWKRRNSM